MLVTMKGLLREVNRNTLYAIYKKYVGWYRDRGKLPLCYCNHLQKKEKTIICSGNNASFIFLSDLHWGKNHKLSPLIVKHILNHTGIRRVFSGGDVITHSDESKETMLSLWDDFNSAFSFAEPCFYQIRGNHDDNSYQQKNPNAIFSNEEIRAKQTVGNAVRFGAGFSFYAEDKESKTRYLCLDTGKQFLEDGDYADIAKVLKNTPPNWHIVVISHIVVEWINFKYQSRPYIQRLLDLFDEHNSMNVSKTEIILAGHVHNDYYTLTKGGIPIVTVGSDAYGVACGKFKKSLKHFDEQCITIVRLDYENRMCYCTRIGRGEDFAISLVNS